MSLQHHRIDMYKTKTILPIKAIRDMEIATFTHRTINIQNTLTSLITNNQIHSHHTRNRNNLHTETSRTTSYGTNSLKHKMITIHNSLPENIKLETNWLKFKREIKVLFMENIDKYIF